jgi:HlyD family secretion protein
MNAQMTQNVVMYTVAVTFDNSDLRLMPYMTANLQFEVEQHKDVLLVPNVAQRFTPRAEQVAPDDRASIMQGKGGGKKGGKAGGKGGDKGTTAGQDAGQPASPAAPSVPAAKSTVPTPANPIPSTREAVPSAPPQASKAKGPNPAADGESAAAKPSQLPSGPKAQQERGRLWLKDGNYVRPIDVRIGLTDGNNTEVTSSKLEQMIKDAEQKNETVEVVVGEARSDQTADEVNPFAPKLFKGGAQKKSSQ